MAITPLPSPPSRSDPTNFSNEGDAFLGALPTFVTEANAQAAALDLNDTTANSVTSLAIATGAKSLTVDVSKSYQPGMSVKIARTASPSNWMHGDVTSYNTGTGALVVNVTTISGSGTFTDWTITFSAPTGMPVATAESDFIASGASPFAWVKKTLLEVKALIGLVPQATGFTISGGTTPKTLIVPANVTLPTITAGGIPYGSAADVWTELAKGAANLKMFMNAGATAPEWAAGTKLGAFTYDTATANGDQVITGVGFKPSFLIMLANITETPQMSIGFSDGTQNYSVLWDTGTSLWASDSYVVFLIQAVSNYARSVVSALGADGFTLTWVKVGAKTGTANIYYMAFR